MKKNNQPMKRAHQTGLEPRARLISLRWPATLGLVLGLSSLTPVSGAETAAEQPKSDAVRTTLSPPPTRTEKPAEAPPETLVEKTTPEKPLRLNFRGASLEMVLNYLSEAAGFIIVLDTELKGKVDVWSNQPVSQEEALTILNAALSKNGYAAIRNERTLTIVTKEEAKKRDLPVKTGGNPQDIPRNEEMVTQIIPVRFVNATQLTKDLQPLMADRATMTANESGNALVITDSQINIRRLAEIVRAIDTSLSSISSVRVFALRYSDAKELATVIKEIFPAQDTTTRNAGGNQGRGGFGGFPGGGGFPGAGGAAGGAGAGGGSSSTPSGRPGASRVVATADERSNSLVVSAPDDVMPTIEEIVKNVDNPVEDVTELRVFRLRNADPVEMASLLSDLFPDETKSNDASRSPVRFGGGPFGGFGGNNANAGAGNSSDRMKKKGKVLAVADQRTSSVVISASHDLMGQISQMVEQLDSSAAKKQKVFVYSLENADVQQVEQILRGMFERNTTSSSRNNQSQTSVLSTRSAQAQSSSVGTGNSSGSGFGNSGGTGGGRSTP